MYECFYLTMLIGCILLGIVSFLFRPIGVKHPKVWWGIFNTLVVVVIVSAIGFIVTL